MRNEVKACNGGGRLRSAGLPSRFGTWHAAIPLLRGLAAAYERPGQTYDAGVSMTMPWKDWRLWHDFPVIGAEELPCKAHDTSSKEKELSGSRERSKGLIFRKVRGSG